MKYRIVKDSDNWYWAEEYNEKYNEWSKIVSTIAFTKWGCKRELNKFFRRMTIDDEIIEEFEV